MKLSKFFLQIPLLILCCGGTYFSLNAQDGHDTKLAFSQTAKPLQVGQGYVHTTDGLLYIAEVGVTPFLSLGVGTVLGDLDGSRNDKGFFYGGGLRAKLAFPLGKKWYIGLSGSALRTFSGEYTSSEMVYIAMGKVTGDFKKIQLTLGGGLVKDFHLSYKTTKPIPIFTTGMIIPLVRKFYFVSEIQMVLFEAEYRDPAYALQTAFLVRKGWKRFSFELGGASYHIDDGDGAFFDILPQVGISFHFKKGKK